MNLKISGQHLEVTEAMRLYVSEKVEKLERHAEHITSIQITFRLDKDRHTAEADIHVSGANLHASATDENMYTAIDLMIDRLDRQAQKHKEKTLSRQQGHR